MGRIKQYSKKLHKKKNIKKHKAKGDNEMDLTNEIVEIDPTKASEAALSVGK